MTAPGEVARVTLRVAHTFESLGIPYALVGSVASSLHGVMRTTLGVDFIAEVGLVHLPPLVAELAQEFYADEEMMRDAVEHASSFNLIHYETALKVDVFCTSRAFDRVQLARRQAVAVTESPRDRVYVISAEDVVLSKLEWYRLSGERSERQWRDLIAVLKVRAEALDLGYMRAWAAELALGELLERALQAAGLSSRR